MRIISKLTVLLLLAIVMPASAQSTFREAFTNFQKVNPSNTMLSGNTMRNALSNLNKSLLKNYDEEISNKLLDEYINERLFDDVVDATMEYFEGKVTTEELNELTSLLNTPKGSAFRAHTMDINKRMENFEQIGVDAMMAITQGNTPEKITEKPGIPKKYKKLFNEYYASSNTNETLSSLIQSLSSLTESNPEGKKWFDQFQTYLNENMPTLYLNEFYGTMTVDDLKFGNKLNNTQAWKNFNKGAKDMISHSTELGMSIVTNYLTWLSNQGEDINF